MSRVIRGGAGERRVVPGEVFDARAEADRTVADARTEAERIVAEARREADAVREEARRAGRAEGEEDAARALLEATRARAHIDSGTERAVVELAMAAARRIVAEELSLAPERIRAIVDDVLARARRAHRITVRVHPDDVAGLSGIGARDGLEASIEADASIARGGCVVTTDLGELDARIEVRLAALEKALLGEEDR